MNTNILGGEIRVPFLLDVHFRSLDFQDLQCLEMFSLNIELLCTTILNHQFPYLTRKQLSTCQFILGLLIFSYNVPFSFGGKDNGGGMILFKLVKMKLYRCLPPCIYEHDIYQAWKSSLSFCTFGYFVSALLDSLCAWQCIKMWDFYYCVKSVLILIFNLHPWEREKIILNFLFLFSSAHQLWRRKRKVNSILLSLCWLMMQFLVENCPQLCCVS